MTTKVIQGAAIKVRVIEDGDLVENGGKYLIAGRTVWPVEFVEAEGDEVVRRIGGREVLDVYVISDEMIASGAYKLIGGPAMKVIEVE
jgi:hypothetical protein